MKADLDTILMINNPRNYLGTNQEVLPRSVNKHDYNKIKNIIQKEFLECNKQIYNSPKLVT